jgi:CDP-glycerol glycerophosphotransferase (TagB/SpsB family)
LPVDVRQRELFKSEFKDKISFDPALVCGEDIKFITEILSDKMTLGLVPHCHYGYRRRSSGEESLVQSAKKKVGWYFDYLDHLTAWAIDFSRKKWGFIPRYVQNIILCDLQWRFFNDYEPTAIKVLGDDGYESYKQKLYSLLGAFDDDIILGQRIIFNEHKCMILSKKYGSLPEKCVYSDDVRLRFNNTCFSWLSGCYTKYDFIRIENGRISIEGFTTAIGYPDDADYRVVYEATSLINGSRREIECEIIPERDVNRYRLDEIMMRGIAFKLDVPACTLADSEIMLVLYANGNRIVKKDVRFGKYCTIGKEFKNAYYLKESFVITVRNNAFVIRPCGRRGALKHEQAFRKELRKSTRLGAKKAAFARFLNSVLLKFKRKPIFLISDRINKASDNGEALFRYLTDTRYRKAKFYYAIRSDCPDYERLSSMKGVINRDSRKYKRIHLAADVIISSHADNNVVDPFIGYSAPYRDILNEKKFVFLQHGVTKDDISAWLNRYNKNLSGFVCSAEREAKSVVEGTYFYDPEAVWLTGMPRFDRLYENGKRLITIMPTWRMYLSVSNNGADSTWKTSPAFLKSEYFNFYNSLINNEKLITACKNHGYTLAFMPHPNLISNIDLFTKNDEVIFFGIDKEYRDIYAESSLVLTDYSSAVFDFAYMRKPVVYAHFDKEEFFAGEHVYTPGYFDYERDGFGEVTYDLDSTVDTLISYIESDCKLKEEYSERIENFFAFSDKDNSKRVIEKTEELVNIK